MDFTFLDNLVKEVQFKTSRSGGKGGQNVNKVATKVELLLDVANSYVLSQEQKELISQKLQNKIDSEGILHIVVQSERTQLGNKTIAIHKFKEAIKQSLIKPKKRMKTKPSKQSKVERLKAKKYRSEIKMGRKKYDI